MEAALARNERLAGAHAAMLEQRQSEGNRALWAAAGELDEPAWAYLARLLRVEEALQALPLDQ